VLVATQSPHAAEVLAALLARYPGPTPVLFGDAVRRESLAAELTAGAAQGPGERELRADLTAVRQNHDAVRRERAESAEALGRELSAAGLPAWEPRLPALAVDVPGAFADDFDPARLRRTGLVGKRLCAARRKQPDQQQCG